MTTRVLFLGDTHGDLQFAARAFEHASDLRADAIFQVGDFGFLWPGKDPDAAMNVLAVLSAQHGIPLYWIDGNHDWHPEIRRRYPDVDRSWSSSGVHHLRRGRVLTIPGDAESTMRICGLGGAPSIDWRSRVEGVTWWPEEYLTDEDLAKVPGGPFDVLATHDAPSLPPGFKRTGDLTFDHRSLDSNCRVHIAMLRSQTPLLIHGHWHKRYLDHYDTRYGGTYVHGLDCNYAALTESSILVTKNDDGTLTVG